MKRLVAIILVILSVSSPLRAEEVYDPQHTMLAFNMAIVSIHRIISTQDRIILDQEYNTIINKLALGNIESDYEMTGLYWYVVNPSDWYMAKAVVDEKHPSGRREIFMSYDDLRNDPKITYSYLQELFKDFPYDEVVPALMELKELE